MKQIILALSVVGVLVGCDQMREKRDAAQQAIDSLRTELATHKHLTETLLQVGTMLDSIDASRHALNTGMLETSDHVEYVTRLSDINRYVQDTEVKVKNLERELRRSSSRGNATYAAALKKVRGELDIRTRELTAMKEQADAYKLEGDQLRQQVDEQKVELSARAIQITRKQEELDKLDGQVKHLVEQAKTDQAEQLFLRAEVVEELANRTHFAPRKKKQSRKEALELYRLALDFGKSDAQARIEALQREM